jgi:DNA-binding transcriptional LysR family regulator
MIRATLQQLRVFQAVAEHRSFTKAAEEIHLTQPGVSIQVKRLEEILDTTLFEKMGNQIYLTAEGKELQQTCHDLFDRLALFEEKLKELSGDVAGPLNICVISSAKYFLPFLLGNFVRRHPKVEPRLKVTNRANLLNRLAANEDDLYITGLVPEDLPVVEHPFLENILVVVAHPTHPLARKKKLSLEQISAERFVGRESGSGTRKAVEDLFQQHGLQVSPYIELSSSEAIKQGVMAGLGLAVLSLHSLSLEIAAKKLVVLDVEGFPLRRRWYAVHRKSKRLSRAAQTFLDYLREEGEEEVQHLLSESETIGS